MNSISDDKPPVAKTFSDRTISVFLTFEDFSCPVSRLKSRYVISGWLRFSNFSKKKEKDYFRERVTTCLIPGLY